MQDGHHNALDTPKDFDLRLPDLSSFAYGPIQDLGTLDVSSVTSSAESIDIPEVVEDDIWRFPKQDEKEHTIVTIKTWDNFHDKTFREPRSVYISEAGPQAFDAALVAQAGHTTDGKSGPDPGLVIQSGPLLASLLHLGLGVESILYFYSQDERSFRPYIENGRMSGYSLGTFSSLSSTLIDHGNRTRSLQCFVDDVRSSEKPFPALTALANTFSIILLTLQAQIGGASRSIRSLLQLQSLLERPGKILSCLHAIVYKIDGTSTAEELLSKLYEMVQDSEHEASWLRPTIFQVFANVSKPWLDSVSGWLGLEDTALGFQHQIPDFVRVSEEVRKVEGGRETKNLEYELELRSMPSFMPKEDALLVFETGKSLQLLKTHQPEHALARPGSLASVKAPELEWQFSWPDIENIQARAKEYESNLQEAIENYNTNADQKMPEDEDKDTAKVKPADAEISGLSEATAKGYINASIANFEKPLPELSTANISPLSNIFSEITSEITSTPSEEIFTPPISLLPILSFNPLISAQAHLINRACLRLLFKEHNLRAHLSLLNRYSLFGDGVFTSRLSHALFDPDLQSAERQKGHSRSGTSGLKLGYRDSWPPASSELRLALMGILTDSYYNTSQVESASMFRAELPGGLSFAIREMSEEELQRCIDPNSIEALDFFKLQYQPPSPLDAVITQASLAKYDVIFKLLLRAVRMMFVVNQLSHTKRRGTHRNRGDVISQSFRIESHHFVLAICSYIFDGVQASSHLLEQKLKSMEKALDRHDTSNIDSLHKLRDFHEQVLDRMMFTLLLRKRQVQIMKLLEEIFGLILLFAKSVRDETAQSDGVTRIDGEVIMKEVYGKFKKKVKVFISVCRGLSERRGQGGIKELDEGDGFLGRDDADEAGGNAIGQLLLKFEMSGFYGR